METIGRQRLEIELLLDDAPNLKGEVALLVTGEMARATRYARQALRRYGKATPAAVAKPGAASYTEGQVLGDWFPGDAPLPADGERE